MGVDVAFDRVLQIVDGMEGPRRRRKDTDGLSHTHRIAHLPTSVNHPTVSVHKLAASDARCATGHVYGSSGARVSRMLIFDRLNNLI